MANAISSYLNQGMGNENMKEIFQRAIFHFTVGIILVLVWSYFSSEWWSPVIGVLGAFNFIPALFAIFVSGEEYRTAVAKTEEEARKLIGAGFEYVCTHNETMIFRRPKYED